MAYTLDDLDLLYPGADDRRIRNESDIVAEAGTAGDRAEAILCAILENDHDRQYNAGDHLEDQENQLQGIHSKKPPKTAAVTAAACRNQPKGRIYIQCLQ